MTTEQKIEQVAEKLYPKNPFWIGSGDSSRLYDEFKSQRDSFINGVKSEVAKEYWFEKFKEEQIRLNNDFGWECESSPTGFCDYEQEDGSYDEDYCRYCGNPEERK
jgi:hypothetical protein